MEARKVAYNLDAPILSKPAPFLILGQKVGWTRCDCCLGRGTYLFGEKVEKCHACRQTGYVPDAETQKLITFVRDWGDL